jgi:hypothetical protein
VTEPTICGDINGAIDYGLIGNTLTPLRLHNARVFKLRGRSVENDLKATAVPKPPGPGRDRKAAIVA